LLPCNRAPFVLCNQHPTKKQSEFQIALTLAAAKVQKSNEIDVDSTRCKNLKFAGLCHNWMKCLCSSQKS